MRQDGLRVLALEVTPADYGYREPDNNNKRKMQTFVSYMQGYREPSEGLDWLRRSIHNPGLGWRTPRMLTPGFGEDVLPNHSGSGSGVDQGLS